jgi:hypothetical protein
MDCGVLACKWGFVVWYINVVLGFGEQIRFCSLGVCDGL